MFRPFYLTLPLLFTTVPFGGTPNRREFGCKRIAQKNSMPLASQIRWRQKHKQSGNQAVLSINQRFPFFWDTCWFLGNHAHWEPFFLRGEKNRSPKEPASSYTQNPQGWQARGGRLQARDLILRQRLLIRKVEHAGLPASLQLVWMCCRCATKKKHTHTHTAKTDKGKKSAKNKEEWLFGNSPTNPHF